MGHIRGERVADSSRQAKVPLARLRPPAGAEDVRSKPKEILAGESEAIDPRAITNRNVGTLRFKLDART